jgi:hypothetical protein
MLPVITSTNVFSLKGLVTIVDDIRVPQQVLDAMEISNAEGPGEPYEFRVTELLDSGRIAQLRRLHCHDIQSPASSMMWALVGKGVHKVIEEASIKRGGEGRYIPEKKLYSQIAGVTVTGQIDLQVVGQRHHIQSDFKLTTAFSVENHIGQWESQLNAYAYLHYCEYGFDPDALLVIAMYRDWNSRDARITRGYPPRPFQKHLLPIWPLEQRRAFLEERVRVHLEAWAGAEMNELPLCSPRERWMDQKFAVKSTTAKMALRTFSCRETAEEFLLAEQKTRVRTKLVVIQTKPIPRRCRGNWCRVSRFCNQYLPEQQHEETTRYEQRDNSDGDDGDQSAEACEVAGGGSSRGI